MRKEASIVIQIADRQTCVRLDRARLRRAVRAVLRQASVPRARISLAMVDDATIAPLNRQFLDHKGPTDVLSFVLERDEGWLEGEVVASAETARREAPQFGWTPHDELLLYVVHGMLHLVGCDDRTAGQRVRMRTQERIALAECGIAKMGSLP